MRLRNDACDRIGYSEYLQLRDVCVAALAHRCWMLRGCPEGCFDTDWLQAEREFDEMFLAQLDLGIPA